MELYFKDLEEDVAANAIGGHCGCEDAAGRDAAEEIAFAELSERVSAARLVY